MVLVIIPLIELGRILNFIPYITETTRVFFIAHLYAANGYTPEN